MTTYMSDSEIYKRSMRQLLDSRLSEQQVLLKLREHRKLAAAARLDARRADFVQPFVSYIPAYGAEIHARAMIDYCRLRRQFDRSRALKSWLMDSIGK